MGAQPDKATAADAAQSINTQPAVSAGSHEVALVDLACNVARQARG